MIHEEIARLEKLQRLAEKIHQEAKMTDSKLDDIEAWIEDEAKRIDHLHPKDAKNNCEQIERELARTEETIKSMFSDVQILRDNRFSQSQDLHRRFVYLYTLNSLLCVVRYPLGRPQISFIKILISHNFER